jgi:hypothetical protein
MAYTLLWTRILELDRESFAKFAEDVRLILSRAEDMGIRLAGPTGKGKPDIGPETIAFNGSASCGHRFRDLGKPFGSPTASGIEEVDPPYDVKAEPWISGPMLETRVCGGNCAGEGFVVDRKYMVRDWERPEEPKRYACSCETHFKPYDLIVAAALVRLKERLGDGIKIAAENPENSFEDAKRFCRELFGWAVNFEIETRQAEILR